MQISKLILQIGWNKVHRQGMSKLCDDDMKTERETINPLVYGKNKNNRKKRIGGEKARFKGRTAFRDVSRTGVWGLAIVCGGAVNGDESLVGWRASRLF